MARCTDTRTQTRSVYAHRDRRRRRRTSTHTHAHAHRRTRAHTCKRTNKREREHSCREKCRTYASVDWLMHFISHDGESNTDEGPRCVRACECACGQACECVCESFCACGDIRLSFPRHRATASVHARGVDPSVPQCRVHPQPFEYPSSNPSTPMLYNNNTTKYPASTPSTPQVLLRVPIEYPG
jgi:hypothetical protein